MKTSRSLNPFFLSGICLIMAVIAIAPAAVSAGRQVAPAGGTSPFATSLRDGGRVIMRRTPGLGNDVFVNLWIDGVPVRGMGYGQSYEGFLRPGPHTVAVMVSPKPIDKDPWKMTLDVKAGATYSFTAASYAGHLVLKPNR